MQFKMYVHGSKESNWELAEELKLTEEATKNFVYACYEVTLDCTVDELGNVKIIGCNGAPLAFPVDA